MIKKLLNVILCLSLLVQNFAFAMPVNAETNKPVIRVNGLEQNGEKLDFVDGNYIVDEYKTVYVDFDLENVNLEERHYLKIESDNGSGSGSDYTGEYKPSIHISPDKEVQNYTLKLCDNWDCNEVYAEESFSIKLAYYNEIKESKVIISDIYQGGKEVTLSDGNQLKFNNKQNITFKVKGENLVDAARYTVSTGGYMNWKSYLGSELEQGIEVTHYPNLSDSNFHVSVYMEEMYFYTQNLYYDDESSEYIYYNISNVKDESVADYTYEFSYKNYPNIKINQNTII